MKNIFSENLIIIKFQTPFKKNVCQIIIMNLIND